MKLNVPFNVRIALWMGAVTIALCAIFIPLWFETGDKLPAEWAEEVSIPPLEDDEVELASIRAPDALGGFEGNGSLFSQASVIESPTQIALANQASMSQAEA